MDASTHEALSLVYGLIVGVSLGLTGGGGSIFAVPLLIYGLGVPVGTSIGLSLAAVGLTAGFGAAMRLRMKEVDLRAGLVFALAGKLFAPAGAWLGTKVPAALLLSAFALLYVTGMSIHHAVATSLLVIFLISLSGVLAHVAHGQSFPMPVTALFVGGGFADRFAGHALRAHFSGSTLERLFAIGMWFVAAYMLARNFPAFFRS